MAPQYPGFHQEMFLMNRIDIARALRDAEYRNSLSDAERAQLPAHPAGLSDIEDDALRTVTGGCGPKTTSISSCVTYPENCP
jgi:mersacidin/lichenicidin family type 2 lantibiotic